MVVTRRSQRHSESTTDETPVESPAPTPKRGGRKRKKTEETPPEEPQTSTSESVTTLESVTETETVTSSESVTETETVTTSESAKETEPPEAPQTENQTPENEEEKEKPKENSNQSESTEGKTEKIQAEPKKTDPASTEELKKPENPESSPPSKRSRKEKISEKNIEENSPSKKVESQETKSSKKKETIPKSGKKSESAPKKSSSKRSEIAAPNKDTDKQKKTEEKPVAMKKEEPMSDDDESPMGEMKRQTIVQSRSCPYLDTINRGYLDFDFEKLCSVSLSHLNAYACLVCGKYFQGRGIGTHAYIHALDVDHRVFLNLKTLKFYCLPDNYEIIDSSLGDIQYVLKPTFTKELINTLEVSTKLYRAYDGSTYHPGIVGLNNIKANDYCNVILHALSQITPIRHYFLREDNYANVKRTPGDNLVLLHQRFGELLRKLWNPRAFKAHVSPHEMLQSVVLCSQKRFQITAQGDAIDFLSWFLNALHLSLNGTKKTSSSVIFKTFRGQMRVYTKKVLPVDATQDEQTKLLLLEEYKERDEDVPFLYLTLDLPSAPLYRDELLQNIIPQVPLGVLLGKFSGEMEKEYKTYKENVMKRFELTRLPPYLILYVKRFTKNTFFTEKNPTIINFPIKNVDMFECLSEDARLEHRYTTYDMVANVVHDGKPTKGAGSYRVQLAQEGSGKWFELEDLHVKEILPQMIPLTETYIQFWKLNTTKTREERSGEEEEGMNIEPPPTEALKTD